MEDLVKSMNAVLTEWKKEYDLTQSVSMDFMFNPAEQRLYFKDRAIAFVDDEALEAVEISAEHIIFMLPGKRRIYVNIVWPEDETPYVSSVLFGYIF